MLFCLNTQRYLTRQFLAANRSRSFCTCAVGMSHKRRGKKAVAARTAIEDQADIAGSSGVDSQPTVPAPHPLQEKGARLAQQLKALYPAPPIPLNHGSTFQLLVAVMLSAQVISTIVCPLQALTIHLSAS